MLCEVVSPRRSRTAGSLFAFPPGVLTLFSFLRFPPSLPLSKCECLYRSDKVTPSVSPSLFFLPLIELNNGFVSFLFLLRSFCAKLPSIEYSFFYILLKDRRPNFPHSLSTALTLPSLKIGIVFSPPSSFFLSIPINLSPHRSFFRTFPEPPPYRAFKVC